MATPTLPVSLERLAVAARAPLATDDSAAGYAPGARWLDTTGPALYELLDSTVGAAVWSRTAVTGGMVPATRTLTAGAGLTGGGNLTADRTFDIVAGDGTIIVAANSIGVGTVPAGQVSGLASIATSGSAANLVSGIIPDARMPDLTGDVTTVEGAVATTIAADAVTNAKLANMTGPSFKLRQSGTGDPEDGTPTQATALLNAFTDSLKGLAPASGGGTTNFLRADGTWAAPGGGPGGGATHVTGTLAFGATPADETSVTIATSGLAATDHIDAFVMADDTTGTNDATAHRFLAVSGRLSAEYVSATSLRVYCDLTMGLATGDFIVHARHAA